MHRPRQLAPSRGVLRQYVAGRRGRDAPVRLDASAVAKAMADPAPMMLAADSVFSPLKPP